MSRYLFFLILILSYFPMTSFALDLLPQGIVEAKKLTLQEAVDLAIRQNPTIKFSQRTFEAALAKIGETRAGFLPQVGVSAAYTRATANFAPQPNFPIFSGLAESDISYNNYSANLNFSQLLYDFGQLNFQYHAVEKLAQSSDSDRKTAEATLIFNVKQAYYGLLQNLQIQKVNEETVLQMEKHLEQAEGFFRAGSKPRFDVTKAQVDLTNAKLNLIKAKNDVQITRVNLNNAMSVPVDFVVEPIDQLVYKKEEITLEMAQKLALENRPELVSVRLKKQSSLLNLEGVKRLFFPQLTANGKYNYQNFEFPLVHNWSFGATLNFPLFSGFQTVKQVDEAQANYEAVSAQEEIQIQNILLDVRQAYLNLTAAEEQISTSELIVKQAEENLDLAEGRYRAGVGTAIETTDAEVSVSNAKTSAVQALYNYNVAKAQLDKAIGK